MAVQSNWFTAESTAAYRCVAASDTVRCEASMLAGRQGSGARLNSCKQDCHTQALVIPVSGSQPSRQFWLDRHATAIPSRLDPFSSDQGSQTGLGSTSTRLSDRPGTLSAVVYCHHKQFC